jgi:UDP-N-acetylmuramate--alanine ligase
MIVEPPDRLPTLQELGRVFVVGIGGSAMSAVARIAFERGIPVAGSDIRDSAVIQALRDLGITCHLGHDPAHVADADTVVVSTAHTEDVPEIAAALRRGLRILHRATATAVLAAGSRQVAVAGAHGKTSTCAMLATALVGAGLDPSYLIGAVVPGLGTNAHAGKGEVFVVEADESDGSFLHLSPSLAVVTNVDPDHLENYGDDPSAYHAAFDDFAARMQDDGVLVACADDTGSAALAARVRATGRRVVTYGRSADADARMVDTVEADVPVPAAGQTFTTVGGPGSGATVVLQVPGAHFGLNALAAHTVLCLLGLRPPEASAWLGTYRGTVRRFEHVGTAGGVVVYDDYGHHPTEMSATVATARQTLVAGGGAGRLVVLYRPLRYTRTQRMAPELGAALGGADMVVVLDPSGDEPIDGISGAQVAAAVPLATGRVHYRSDPADGVAVVVDALRPGDLLLTLGAGDVAPLGRQVIAALGALGPHADRTPR